MTRVVGTKERQAAKKMEYFLAYPKRAERAEQETAEQLELVRIKEAVRKYYQRNGETSEQENHRHPEKRQRKAALSEH